MTPLRQRYLEDRQLRNYSVKTQQVYVECVSLFARHFNQSPERLGPDETRAYQLYLIQEKHVNGCQSFNFQSSDQRTTRTKTEN